MLSRLPINPPFSQMQRANETVSIVRRHELIYCHKLHPENVSRKHGKNRFQNKSNHVFFPIFITDHFTSKLSVRTRDGPDLVSTSFTFFDCSTHLSCTQCVSSQFPCDWCVEAHRCTHDTADNCRNDILVTGVSVSHIILIHKRFWF